MKKVISILLIMIITFLTVTPADMSYAMDKNIISLSGYAYDPSSENGFDLVGDISLSINLLTNKGKLVSDKDVFELDFDLDKEYDDRVDYNGKAINEETSSRLLLSVINDDEIKVFGLIDGAFAFNAGNTLKHSELQKQLSSSIDKSSGDMTIMNSSDSYVVSQGSKNNVYAQLIKPPSHPYDTHREYFIRINTLTHPSEALRTVRYFNAVGSVRNAYLSSIDPSGYKKMTADWYYILLYFVASYVGVYVDNSNGYYYDGSKYLGNFDLSVGTSSKWNNFKYSSDSNNNGCPFVLEIRNSENRLPSITVNTSLDIYETLTGYLTITGPTLNY